MTETSILYKDGYTAWHKDGHMHGQMDRQADSSIPMKTLILQGYKNGQLWKEEWILVLVSLSTILE